MNTGIYLRVSVYMMVSAYQSFSSSNERMLQIPRQLGDISSFSALEIKLSFLVCLILTCYQLYGVAIRASI